jgi:hypothetical protein
MDESKIVGGEPFIPDHHAPEFLEPGIRPFNLPPFLVAAEFAPILMRRLFVVLSCWHYRFDTALGQFLLYGIGVIRAIHDQVLGLSSEQIPGPLLDGYLQRFHLGRRCRLQENSERSTRAIGQYQKLASLAALGLADLRPPFFADTNVPSTKHSFQRICCFSFNCDRKARHRSSRVPSLAHRQSRR